MLKYFFFFKIKVPRQFQTVTFDTQTFTYSSVSTFTSFNLGLNKNVMIKPANELNVKNTIITNKVVILLWILKSKLASHPLV